MRKVRKKIREKKYFRLIGRDPRNNDRIPQFIESPNARKLKVKGFENFDFFIHKDWDWLIIEAGTGTSIGKSSTIKNAALKAEGILKSKEAVFIKAVIKSIKKYGHSPRYEYFKIVEEE